MSQNATAELAVRWAAGVGHVFAACVPRSALLRAAFNLKLADAEEHFRRQALPVAGYGRAVRVDPGQNCRNPLQCFTIDQPCFVDDQDVSFFELGDYSVFDQGVV